MFLELAQVFLNSIISDVYTVKSLIACVCLVFVYVTLYLVSGTHDPCGNVPFCEQGTPK